VAAVAFASWCATVAAAASCAEQLALSGTARGAVVFLAMLGVHALIGVGEAVITASIIASVLRFRPELLGDSAQPGGARARASSPVWAGLGLSLAIAVLLAPLASASPDGLAQVAQSLGLQGHGRASLAESIGLLLGKGLLVTVLAGCSGTLLLFGACWLLARALAPRAPLAAAALPSVAPEGLASRPAVESSG
jgi:cobalt/nickel transport system permease protein